METLLRENQRAKKTKQNKKCCCLLTSPSQKIWVINELCLLAVLRLYQQRKRKKINVGSHTSSPEPKAPPYFPQKSF
jgi:hypothetical protein